MKRQLAGLLFAALAAPMGASAAVNVFDLTPGGGGSFVGGGYNNAFQVSSHGVNLRITGWSDTYSPNDSSSNGYDAFYDSRLERGQVTQYGSNGLGMINQDEVDDVPNHSVDSAGVRSRRPCIRRRPNGSCAERGDRVYSADFDALLLRFSTPQILHGFTIGWDHGPTADISVLRNDGDGSSSGLGSSQTWNSILNTASGDWEVIATKPNVDDGVNNGFAYVGSSKPSKFYLISIWNPVFGGQLDYSQGFKLSSVITKKRGEVPIPGTLALVLIGMLGFRRRLGLGR